MNRDATSYCVAFTHFIITVIQVLCLEAERIHQEETLAKFKDTLQRQKQDNKELFDKLAALEEVDHRLEMCENRNPHPSPCCVLCAANIACSFIQ